MGNRKRPNAGGVTLRAVLIGFAHAPPNVYLVVQWETVWTTQYPTTMGIFFNTIFCLWGMLGLITGIPTYAFRRW